MISLRTFLLYNIMIIAFLAWRVHQGMPMGSAITVGSWSVAVCNGALAIKWLRTRNRPKAVTLGRFPWRQWGTGAIGFMVLIVLRRDVAADLAFLAILGFVLTVAFWLWDRHTLRRDGQSEQSR